MVPEPGRGLGAGLPRLEREGRWPSLAETARTHPGGPEEFLRIWREAPVGAVRSPDGLAAPLVRAFSFLDQAAPLFLEGGRPGVLDSQLAAGAVGLDGDRLQLVSELLWNEPGLSGVRVRNHEWAWSLDDGILNFRKVHSVQGYRRVGAVRRPSGRW